MGSNQNLKDIAKKYMLGTDMRQIKFGTMVVAGMTELLIKGARPHTLTLAHRNEITSRLGILLIATELIK